MNILTKMCFLCFNENKLINVPLSVRMTNQVKYILPEFSTPKAPLRICSSCITTLESFDNFKKICLKNYERLKIYIHEIEETNDNDKNVMEFEINNTERGIIHIKEEIEDTLHSLEKQTCFADDNIDIKEEFTMIELDTDNVKEKDVHINIKEETEDINIKEEELLMFEEEKCLIFDSIDIKSDYLQECSPNTTKNDVQDLDEFSSCYDSDLDQEYNLSRKDNSEDEYVSTKSPIDFEESMTVLDEAHCLSKSTNECIHPTETKKGKNKKVCRKRKFDFCFFCKSEVSNFARHLCRNHNAELEVQNLLSYPVKSKKRNELLTLIRKRGNYLKNTDEGKPVRKGTYSTTYLACIHCLGFYSSKNLWKHRQQCSENPDKEGSTTDTKSNAQTVQLGYLKLDPELREKVFPHMRADKISLTAMKDPLICAFAARYFKTHKKKQNVSVVSRKMRELSRLLIEIKNKEPSLQNLFSALKPQYFDLLVAATKTVSEYDDNKKFYKSPTYAIKMGTSLKQCCDIALLYSLHKNDVYVTLASAETEADLKTLIRLIENNWKFDISNQAYSDLHSNRWNKVTIVTLATDLKLLKDYLITKANESVSSLNQRGANERDYITLLQTVFCRVILLNRKRPGELQRFLLRTYEDSISNDKSKTDEEFSEVTTVTEKALMKPFKRVVIRAKRGRDLAVLFSRDIQEHLQILLQHRSTVMQKPNIFLFGNLKSNQPIIGYKILRKYASECGAQNPNAITCTSLRKHLAILTQLFNLTESDMEQLATFIEHTLNIHKSFCRFPGDLYQTAKISKLLMLMEKGMAGEFKGKTFDEIDLNMDDDLMVTNIEEENETERTQQMYAGVDSDIVENCETINDKDTAVLQTNANPALKDDNNKIRNGSKRVLIPWTDEQKSITSFYFKKHIQEKKPPKRGECELLISQHPEVLKNKDWLKIKVFIQNKYSRKLK